MKTNEELNASKVPIVIIDKSLDKLDDVVLFPEKVEKAKETIAKSVSLKNSTAANHK